MHDFSEFTEPRFRDLLRQLKDGGYQFIRFGETCENRHVIWRHDVDFSMHRAARLAEIEAEESISATYFLNPRAAFYNLLEPEIEKLTQRIVAAGHDIGLHFDAGAYQVENWSRTTLNTAIGRERNILENILETKIHAMSWHNPDFSNLLTFDENEIGGLINAYGRVLRKDYTYCSDSNGYWRFEPMDKVIAAGHARLHLLTHPEMWTPDAMSPSARVDRAIFGRAHALRRTYDALLARGNRKNLT